MATKMPKPWLRGERGWYVTIEGKQYPLGRDKDEAFAEYHRLMTQSKKRRQVSAQSFAAVANEFLDFVERTRGTAIVLASQKLLERELANNRRQADEWQSRAEQAMAAGDDDLARKALGRKQDNDRVIELNGDAQTPINEADLPQAEVAEDPGRVIKEKRLNQTLQTVAK